MWEDKVCLPGISFTAACWESHSLKHAGTWNCGELCVSVRDDEAGENAQEGPWMVFLPRTCHGCVSLGLLSLLSLFWLGALLAWRSSFLVNPFLFGETELNRPSLSVIVCVSSNVHATPFLESCLILWNSFSSWKTDYRWVCFNQLQFGGWRDGSEVRSTGCSSIRPVFSSCTHMVANSAFCLKLGALPLLSGLCVYWMHVVHRRTCKENIHIQKIKKLKITHAHKMK